MCSVDLKTLIYPPFSLQYGDPVNARFHRLHSPDDENILLLGSQTLDLIFSEPERVTGELVFGDEKAEWNEIWFLPEETDNEAEPNKLLMLQILRDED